MTVSAQCTNCIRTLKSIVTVLLTSGDDLSRNRRAQASDALDRIVLWVGNIGALNPPNSPMSLESRLHKVPDLLEYTSTLLDDLCEVILELLDVISGNCAEGRVLEGISNNAEELEDEETKLLEEIDGCITRLFRVTSLIRGNERTEKQFDAAVRRRNYPFDDRFDIAHVGQKFPKLNTLQLTWLKERLGRAITERRQYLSYSRDHQERIRRKLDEEENSDDEVFLHQKSGGLPAQKDLGSEYMSRPSTSVTKATTLASDIILPQGFSAEEESDFSDDATCTTVSRSVHGDLDASLIARIPKLSELPKGTKRKVQCPFCFQVMRFKNERVWRRHVFSDLRAYVCTFPNCSSPYFSNCNDWFQHEMNDHRVSYICQLCDRKSYASEELYLAHVSRKHASIPFHHDRQSILEVARKPLKRILPHHCPCCTDWIDRLKARVDVDLAGSSLRSGIIDVTPDVFRRHLASHLEQLALFSLPLLNSSADGDAKSMAANDDWEDALSNHSIRSPLSFGSPTSLPVSEPEMFDDGAPISAASYTPDALQESEEGPSHVSPTSSSRATRSTNHDLQSKPTAAESDVAKPADLPLPPLEVAASSEDTSDSTPYPVFLRPQQTTAKLDEKWNDLEWDQMNRLREGMAPKDDDEPSQWARCNGEPYCARNRYMNVDPYQVNRVRLSVPVDASDYINASPITLVTTRTDSILRYIATQGPKAGCWSHFWRMLWHETESPAVVVMVTKTHEQGREKCYPYYPQSMTDPDLLVNEHDEFGDGFVQNLRLAELSHEEELRIEIREIEVTPRISKPDLTIMDEQRTINLKDEIRARKVWHLLFRGWPDFSVPEDADRTALLNTIGLSRKLNVKTSNPRIVHCSAGIGRTGTFIALDWLIQELEEGALDDPPENYDPIVCVIKVLRDQRPMMVQSKQQFIFMYDILRDRWRERWTALHPEEAKQLKIAAVQEQIEGRALKRQKSKLEDDSDAAFMSDYKQRMKLEAELMGVDYE